MLSAASAAEGPEQEKTRSVFDLGRAEVEVVYRTTGDAVSSKGFVLIASEKR
jgi:hypothetical protein